MKRPRTPMKRPVATITGMIGTKTSPKVRIARWNQFPCLAASAFMSSLDDVGKPSATTSSYILFTVPVPKMIWY